MLHIADWLTVALAEDAPWLSNIDASGRPKKLLKFADIDGIKREADRDMLRRAARAKAEGVDRKDGEGTVHFADLADGYRMVRLLTPSALDAESAEMQHCIGNGTYDAELASPDNLFLSMRDRLGKPHATLDIRSKTLVQFSGKQNAVPVRRYLDVALPWLEREGVTIDYASFDMDRDVNGSLYTIETLPETLVVEGNVSLWNAGPDPVRLPNVIEASGNVTIGRGPFLNVPARVVAGLDFSMRGSSMESLPATLVVGFAIDVAQSQVKEIPADLTVNGKLDLSNTGIAALPSGLAVLGPLDVSYTQLTELPADLKCSSIHLSGTGVRRFDTSAFDMGSAYVSTRSLTAAFAKLETIVGRPHFTSLYLRGTPMRELPPGLSVSNLLEIVGSPIERLPRGVSVGRGLEAGHPERSFVLCSNGIAGDVTIRSSHVGFSSNGFDIPGALTLDRCVLANVPHRMKASVISLRDAVFERLPAEVEAELIDIRGTPVRQLGGRITVDTLMVSDEITAIGPNVRARVVPVSGGHGVVRLTLDEVRARLSAYGSLKGMAPVPAFGRRQRC